jgi:hypothetical protein
LVGCRDTTTNTCFSLIGNIMKLYRVKCMYCSGVCYIGASKFETPSLYIELYCPFCMAANVVHKSVVWQTEVKLK